MDNTQTTWTVTVTSNSSVFTSYSEPKWISWLMAYRCTDEEGDWYYIIVPGASAATVSPDGGKTSQTIANGADTTSKPLPVTPTS